MYQSGIKQCVLYFVEVIIYWYVSSFFYVWVYKQKQINSDVKDVSKNMENCQASLDKLMIELQVTQRIRDMGN